MARDVSRRVDVSAWSGKAEELEAISSCKLIASWHLQTQAAQRDWSFASLRCEFVEVKTVEVGEVRYEAWNKCQELIQSRDAYLYNHFLYQDYFPHVVSGADNAKNTPEQSWRHGGARYPSFANTE